MGTPTDSPSGGESRGIAVQFVTASRAKETKESFQIRARSFYTY